MNRLRSLTAITLMFLRPALRSPLVTLLVSTLPVSFIVIFQVIGGSELSRHALFGSLVVFATNVGIVSMPQLANTYKNRSLQDMFVASPVGPMTYAGGMGLSRLGWVAPGLALLIGALVITGGLAPRNIPAVVLVILVTWFTGIMIGFTTASLWDSPQTVGVVANMFGMLFSVLPPVYYPLAMIPEPYRWLPMIVPTTHAAQLVRIAGGLAETTPAMQALHWTVLIGFAVICGIVTVKKAHWRQA